MSYLRPCFHGKLLSCAALRCSCMKACHVNRGNARSPTLATWRHDDVMKWQVAWPKLARRGHQNLGFVVACCWPSLPPLSHLFGDTRQCLRHCRFTSSKVDWYVTSILNPSHKQRYTKYTKIATNTPKFTSKLTISLLFSIYSIFLSFSFLIASPPPTKTIGKACFTRFDHG